ncbi:hypothetical protein FA13DRAFT_140191 [Coprinellus micaceus]|uniref:Uncharacterized protein n=1 Tax=Coprinellus micaceus TaxID=71717 RepID=A0A4Y7SHQ7_COPMI|nr:hypothetical protein FA13DRAFT_140191 [Coprinellus micaceus]
MAGIRLTQRRLSRSAFSLPSFSLPSFLLLLFFLLPTAAGVRVVFVVDTARTVAVRSFGRGDLLDKRHTVPGACESPLSSTYASSERLNHPASPTHTLLPSFSSAFLLETQHLLASK